MEGSGTAYAMTVLPIRLISPVKPPHLGDRPLWIDFVGMLPKSNEAMLVRCQMNEVPTLVTSCINCFSPGSLNATLVVILIGAGIAWTAERRKLGRVRSNK